MKDNFLSNPDDLDYAIVCIECKKPLWTTRILKRSGSRVVSTETKRCAGVTAKFDRHIEDCPICSKRFYMVTPKGHMYLIRDNHSNITRLI